MPEIISPLTVAAKQEGPSLRNRDKEMIPVVLLRAMLMLAIASLLLVSYAVFTDRPLVGVPQDAPVLSEHAMVIQGSRRGAVSILAPDGTLVADMSESDAGFISVVTRALDRVRMQNGVPATEPVRIVTYENGRMALVDDASNWSMELGHFGDVGKNRFAELIAALPPSARLN